MDLMKAVELARQRFRNELIDPNNIIFINPNYNENKIEFTVKSRWLFYSIHFHERKEPKTDENYSCFGFLVKVIEKR